jgi:hypothetical protein
MSQRERRYQMKPFKSLLEKRRKAATKDNNAYSKRPMNKKRGCNTTCYKITKHGH